MKKGIILVIMITLTGSLFGLIQANLGIDFAGTHNWYYDSFSLDTKLDLGISGSLEYLRKSSKVLYGAGLEYQIPRGFDTNTGKAKISFIPIYLTAKCCLNKKATSALGVEAIGHIGYNYIQANDIYKHNAKVNGGMYLGLGLGYRTTSLTYQLMYKVNCGTKKYIQTQTEVSSNQVNFSVGYQIKSIFY